MDNLHLALFCSSIEFIIAGIYNSISCYRLLFSRCFTGAILWPMHCELSWTFRLVPILEFLSAMLSLLPIPRINLQNENIKAGQQRKQ
jgi:hypothetical protein